MVSLPDPAAPLTTPDVLRIAFPEVAGGSRSQSDVAVEVIPQGPEPRWIVLGDTRIAASVLKSWRPFRVSSRLSWTAVVTAASARMLSRLPGVVSSRASINMAYWRQNLTAFTGEWVPVVHIGNPSHTRKATIFFVVGDGQVKAVAKVPLLEGAKPAILNETRVLSELRAASFLPKPLFADATRGIAAQSWLVGRPVSRELTLAHMELLARLAVPGATIRISSQRAAIATALAQCDLPFDRPVLARALDTLDDDQPLRAFVEHRDFAPWNLKRLPDAQSGAIDWEWATLHGLPCQDLFRYFYIQDALFQGPGKVWQAYTSHPLVGEHCRRFQIPSQALRPLAFHYLLRVLAMDWQSGNASLARHSFGQISSLLETPQP